jgi:hypothetical protein
VTFIIIFTSGYLLGGVSGLILIGLAVAAQRGDHSDTTAAPRVPAEETVAAWRGER